MINSTTATSVNFRLHFAEKYVRPPVCLAIITGGGIARIRDDGVYVLPINAMRL